MATVDRAVARRAAALRALRRVRPGWTIRRLAAASKALPSPESCPDPVARANARHLRACLDLELELVTAVRESAILRADAAYQRLVVLHDTAEASRVALAQLPSAVRGFASDPVAGPVSPLIFAIPFAVLGSHLTAALPPLLACPHGLLSAAGTCRTPPCPQPSPALNGCSGPGVPQA